MIPVLAVLATMVCGALIFSVLGYDGFSAVWQIFAVPVLDPAKWEDLALKAAPLILIATGLAIGFRANVWNIGAEGQYVVGGLAGTGIALATWHLEGAFILPLMCVFGVIGGMAWASIPAVLKTRFGVNEILSSLMLNYVALQLLYYLMRGPWKDPQGFNFPQTRLFTESQVLPFVPGTFVHIGVPICLAVTLVFWFVMQKTVFGFGIRVVGAAPAAARYGGFSNRVAIWACLLCGGGLAGLAGIFEASGSFQQMVPQFPVGYGFTAIIVAFLGRLHPLGIIPAGIAVAISLVGGEIAQTKIGLPAAGSGLFQALLLFFLLAMEVMVNFRLRLHFLSRILPGRASSTGKAISSKASTK